VDEEREIKELLEGEIVERSKIVSVEIKTAKEVYGDKAKEPERPVAKIKAENGADLTVGVPRGMTYDGGCWKVENKLRVQRSVTHKMSGFGNFIRKYRHWPNVGVEVETGIDDSGFARIIV